MSWRDNLDGVHLDIVTSSASRIAVLAGPGTGKTSHGLIRRVARLLEEGVSAEAILLLSFTRTAALDLKAKIEDLNVPNSSSIKATTLHAYCLELLRDDSVLEQTGRVPRILMDHEVKLMLRDLGPDDGFLREREKQFEAYVAGWARAQTDHPGLAELPADRDFENRALRWLRRHEAMDIGEVVPIAYALLSRDPLHPERSKYSHVLVDEYQDLNLIEQKLVELISGESNLFLAGDDDQSIYGFRFANPAGIRDIYQRDGTEGFEIDKCGRCPGVILDIANSLIKREPGRVKGDLLPRSSKQGYLAIVQWPDLRTEVDGIAAAIVSDINNERFEPGDILVLVNRQEIGALLRERLSELNVVAHSYFSQEPAKFTEAQRGLALLQELVAPDPVALRVLIGHGDSKGNSEAYLRLASLGAQWQKSMRHILEEAVRGVKLPIRIPAIVNRFKESQEKLVRLQDMSLPEIVDDLFPEGNPRVAAVRELALENISSHSSAESLLNVLISRITQNDVPERPDFVRIMSLHKSKGLTSRSVFIMSSQRGVLPTLLGVHTPEEEELAVAEQRRLMYVGITRAAEQLVISYFRESDTGTVKRFGIRTAKGRTRKMGDYLVSVVLPSPYIQELGPTAPETQIGANWLESYELRSSG